MTVVELATTAAGARSEPLYTLDEAIARGVVNSRISIYSDVDEQHALQALGELMPGMIYDTFVGSYGAIRQQDIDDAGRVAGAVRKLLPRTLLGGGINESLRLDVPPQTLACGGGLGSQTFALVDMTVPGGKQLHGTAWLDLARERARDYYVCVGTMLIDRGYTIIDFEEHSNVIEHSSSRDGAVANYVYIAKALRRYGASKGRTIYFSGDPTTDATANEVSLLLVPSRFYHVTFAQKYRNKIARPGVGVGYSYSLSPLLVHDIMSRKLPSQRVFFYVDNFDPSQDDLRRFMELDAANRRFLLESSAKTAHAHGAYFIPNLLHCVGCVPVNVLGDKCEIRPNGKSEYDAVTCGDVPTIKAVLEQEK